MSPTETAEESGRSSERSDYAFADREQEDRRLRAQAVLWEPLTERSFLAAGVAGGMRVLDVGSGAGDVAILAARMVGPGGEVVGVERDPDAVTSARARVREADITNVSFVQGDAQTLDAVEGPFDAVVGRLILLFLRDPVAVLRRSVELVRPGGLVWFQEPDLAYEWAQPMTPLWVQVRQWVLETCVRAHISARMGLALPAAFSAAGLPFPESRLESFIRADPEMPVWGYSNLVVGLVPLMQQLGVTTASEVAPDTLEGRLRGELLAAQGVVLSAPLIAVWSRRPDEETATG